MADIFNNKILCNKCDSKMERGEFIKNGFILRAMNCPKCSEKIIHPVDEVEYNKFINLRNKEFKVKMRIVGNSHTVSIPKEIVSFMREQNQRFSSRPIKNIGREQEKMMDNMVRLCFEESGRLSLNFSKLGRKRKW